MSLLLKSIFWLIFDVGDEKYPLSSFQPDWNVSLVSILTWFILGCSKTPWRFSWDFESSLTDCESGFEILFPHSIRREPEKHSVRFIEFLFMSKHFDLEVWLLFELPKLSRWALAWEEIFESACSCLVTFSDWETSPDSEVSSHWTGRQRKFRAGWEVAEVAGSEVEVLTFNACSWHTLLSFVVVHILAEVDAVRSAVLSTLLNVLFVIATVLFVTLQEEVLYNVENWLKESWRLSRDGLRPVLVSHPGSARGVTGDFEDEETWVIWTSEESSSCWWDIITLSVHPVNIEAHYKDVLFWMNFPLWEGNNFGAVMYFWQAYQWIIGGWGCPCVRERRSERLYERVNKSLCEVVSEWVSLSVSVWVSYGVSKWQRVCVIE